MRRTVGCGGGGKGVGGTFRFTFCRSTRILAPPEQDCKRWDRVPFPAPKSMYIQSDSNNPIR